MNVVTVILFVLFMFKLAGADYPHMYVMASVTVTDNTPKTHACMYDFVQCVCVCMYVV